jgi:hypothetical protein
VRDRLDGVDEYKGLYHRVNRLSLLVSSKKPYPPWKAHDAVKAACSNVSRGGNLDRFSCARRHWLRLGRMQCPQLHRRRFVPLMVHLRSSCTLGGILRVCTLASMF